MTLARDRGAAVDIAAAADGVDAAIRLERLREFVGFIFAALAK